MEPKAYLRKGRTASILSSWEGPHEFNPIIFFQIPDTRWNGFGHVIKSSPLWSKSFSLQTENFGELNFLSIPHWIWMRMNQALVSTLNQWFPFFSYAILDWIFCSLQLKASYMKVKPLKHIRFDIFLFEFSLFEPVIDSLMMAVIFQKVCRIWKGQKPIP